MTNNTIQLLTTKQVATIFNVSEATVRSYACSGLPFHRLAGTMRFNQKDVESFLESRKVVNVQSRTQAHNPRLPYLRPPQPLGTPDAIRIFDKLQKTWVNDYVR